jgi:alcohol dehydrogenase class IV
VGAFRWRHPNPTADLISTGAKLARQFQADVILGIGGGSSLDTAKAISLEATHQGTCWDYVYFKQRPSARTLPVVAVGTTAGSGSQVNPVAIIQHPSSHEKSALCSDHLIPRAAIIDPQLMLSVPAKVTATAGFVIFCHAFESVLNPQSNPLTELFGWEAVRSVIKNLPVAVLDSSNLGARNSLAWADTLAGLATCGSGFGLSHGIALGVGSLFADIPYGLALASVYRACLEFTWPSAVSVYARLAQLFDPALEKGLEKEAATRCPELLQDFLALVDLGSTLRDFGIAHEELISLARRSMVFPHYKNNPKVPSREEMVELFRDSY